MSVLSTLILARQSLADVVLVVSQNPKPNYSIDGESYSHGDYLRMLTEQIGELDKMIASEEGPFELLGIAE